jgi:small GTP-binding protein
MENKSLDLNLYEIRLDSIFIENEVLIDNFLFECQCALFLIDITNSDSFNLIKEFFNKIYLNKYKYLKPILVQNKIDLENERQVTKDEIKDFITKHNWVDIQEISVKNGNNFNELINKINEAVNENNNELPSNLVYENINSTYSCNDNKDINFILIGDTTVGKTCLFNRYFKNEFEETLLSTIGIEKETKFVKVKKEYYKIVLWDTAGQERFRSLPKKYYQNANGVLLLFDVNNEKTFKGISTWMQDLKDNSIRNIDGKEESEVLLYLIGNKIDKDKEERVVSRKEAEEMAQSYGMTYFEISCKLNMNIQEIMNRMIFEFHKKNAPIVENSFRLKHAKKEKNKKKKACCKDI